VEPGDLAIPALMHRYVAIGTSVSMGWQSDGLVQDHQWDSWPAQLARASGIELPQPYMADPGCRSPLVAPLASGLRRSGEPAGQPAANAACAGLAPELDVPFRNVAISGATTRDALLTTPELQGDPFYRRLYPFILDGGETQVSTAVALNPKLVSVELGANEVMPARSGVAIPGATITPFSTWAPLYTQVADRVSAVTRRGVMVGLINDVASFPSFRRGAELYADHPTFLAAFNVAVSSDCDASQNLVFVPVRVATAVATGLAYRKNGLPPYVFSCADGGLGVQDFVLTPAEAGVVNAAMAAMDAHIIQTAARVGYAHFALESLYGRGDLKPPFSVVQLMTSSTPYGPYMSLDGIHPNAAGHRVLATAAANALSRRYGISVPAPSAIIASR
jgi:lysophospholipase L1-like esterase